MLFLVMCENFPSNYVCKRNLLEAKLEKTLECFKKKLSICCALEKAILTIPYNEKM